MSEQLANVLVDHGLAVTVGDQHEWLGVDPELGWIYMCALTEEAARQNNLAPTTDQIGAHTASDLWHPGHLTAALFGEAETSAEGSRTVDAQMVALTAVRLVVPANVSSVPVRKIVDLRRRHHDEFNAFLDKVETVASNLSSELAEVRDPNMFQRYLDLEVERELTPPLSNLKAALRDARIDSTLTAVNRKVELPVGAASAAGLLGLMIDPIAGAAGAVAFWVLSAWRTARGDRNEVLKEAPAAAYLLRLEKDLQPRALIGRVGASVHKLNWLKV